MTTSDDNAPTATVFKYASKEITHRKAFDLLCQSELIFAGVQTVSEGGETNLHSHRHLDGFWFVLRGRARFYTTDDEVLADLGPMEGVLVPRNFRYWFERVGDENLEILQVEASDKSMSEVFAGDGDRVDHVPPSGDMGTRRPEFSNMLKTDRESKQH